MKAKIPSGRPSLNRNRVAGEHLRIALKMLGKKWRRDVEDTRHVLNWESWIACGLPRSPTTIDTDIREGIPENRIADYAHCLGIMPELFISPQTDMVKVLADSLSTDDGRTPSMVLGYKEAFPKRYVEHNRQSYMQELFALMNGVYRMHYVLQGVELIHRCTVWVYDVEAYRLLLRGRFSMFGAENEFNGNMFRWHNNLHVHYLCQNEMELGYTMTVDPLRHNLVKRRSPFWLKGQGLTDRGLADNIPIIFTYRMEMLPLPDGMTHEGLWRQECKAVLEQPFFPPGSPEHGALWAQVLSPDDLLS
ncbi:MAG: hypothetical protein KKD85_01220 [Proteobacteria bacterium]|uniref:Uncharacterized protein n=2 Tax=Desulfovibrionaceae TaxID=194924 RepID=E6VY06_PSEA9|nr:hypothetical protein Daes_2824 [Pseudodesulfovibrio aespoeensis Aspo-2]MBU4190941.1 hypothetical protein [Pseudomonadota bacterium]MBU4244308.1 hypothetical protein [Pseudomonadota bacterium]MBU4475586.1 hypothetical protein [Pseudomonadota bacterium]MBU4520839.1 hypothetical protein [Pseudomonadota bacterium]